MSTKEISNSHDIIDSRDVIERIAELEGDLQATHETLVQDAGLTLPFEEWIVEQPGECNEYQVDCEELLKLRAFAEEGEQLADWEHGETLIHEGHFKDYAIELAEDIGAVPKDLGWPCSYIDWDAAADALQMDYTSIDFDGVTYYAKG